MMSAIDHQAPSPTNAGIEAALERVRTALTCMRFGSVSITVHEGRVVQIDITEKERFTPG